MRIGLLSPVFTTCFRCNCLSPAASRRNAIFIRNLCSAKKPSPELPPKGFQGSLVTWKSVLALGVTGVVGYGFLKYLEAEKEKHDNAQRQVSFGIPLIGGDWSLVDHHGNRKTNHDFLGRWVILYFGFSFCPDICPEEMDKLVEAIDRLDNDKSIPNVIPIFITLDPERDSPAHLAKYVSEFSPKVIGMTGSTEAVDRAAKTYRIYYSAGPKDEDNDYIVDHSIIKYLINPDGVMTAYFGQNKTAAEIYTESKSHMKGWKSEKQSKASSS